MPDTIEKIRLPLFSGYSKEKGAVALADKISYAQLLFDYHMLVNIILNLLISKIEVNK